MSIFLNKKNISVNNCKTFFRTIQQGIRFASSGNDIHFFDAFPLELNVI